MLLSSLGLLLAVRVALSAHVPQDNAGWATGPSSTNKSQIFQERLSNNDYVWFDSKDGGEDLNTIQRVGWRLKDDDGSTVIHTYNSSENIVTYEGNALIEVGTNLNTAYYNTTYSPSASSNSSASTWNSSAPFISHSLDHSLYVQGICFGANVSFSLLLSFTNGSTDTVHGGIPWDTLGYSNFTIDLPSQVKTVNITAHNATFVDHVALLYYDLDLKPWKVKSGPGPNLPVLSGLQSTSASYCPY